MAKEELDLPIMDGAQWAFEFHKDKNIIHIFMYDFVKLECFCDEIMC